MQVSAIDVIGPTLSAILLGVVLAEAVYRMIDRK
jgi:hypothetical protein